MKKVVALIAVIIVMMIPVTAFAQVTPVEPFDESKADAGTVMLFNAETGQEIYSKNADEKIFPASTTKLMTALIAAESGKLEDEVKVGEEVTAFGEESSLMGLKAGETIPAKDLLYGMMLVSGNDAAAAMAVHLAGGIDAFAGQMNAKAQELGMADSHFTNPHGVHDDNHYTTGADMKKLAMAVFLNNDLMQVADTKTYTVQPTDKVTETRQLKNTNQLIYTDPEHPEDGVFYYEYANGMKTGLTPQAGGCLVASATKGDLSLIALIYNDTSEEYNNRWTIAKELFDYGFDNFENVASGDFISNYSVAETVANYAENDPESGQLKLTAEPLVTDAQKVMLTKSQAEAVKAGTLDLKTNVNLTRELTAPVKQGDEFGTVDFSLDDGTVIGTAKLVASREVFQLGDEKSQSEALGESPFEYWSKTDVLTEISKNTAVLWWLLIPAGIIILLIVRSAMVNRRRNRGRRMPAAKYYYHRPIMRRRPRYRGRYR